MKKNILILLIFLISQSTLISQNAIEKKVFTDQLVNYGKPDSVNVDPDVIRLQGGRVVLKEVTVPVFSEGTDVNLGKYLGIK